MRNDNGSSWFNVFVATVLIVVGFVAEPLLAILGGIVLLVTLLVLFVEEHHKHKLSGIADEQFVMYSEQSQTLAKSNVTSVIR